MKKLLYWAAVLCMALLLPFSVWAQDLRFEPAGGGKFIYCNNEEGLFGTTLLNGEKPSYIMNNENLTPDRYYLYLSHINYTGVPNGGPDAFGFGYDVELDVELTAVEDSVLRIDNASMETTRVYAYMSGGKRFRYEDEWGCFRTCCDMLGVPLISIDGQNVYQPTGYSPVTVALKAGETVWLSEYLKNYEAVHFGKPVHMQADLTIESGKMNINVGAFRSNGVLKDRSGFDKNAAFGTYKRDRCIKGIADSLPEMIAALQYEITDDMESGTELPVTVFNQYAPDGNPLTGWYIHLNPQNDIWSKANTAESDMLPIRYKDPSKLEYYGKNVPESERDDVWVFDTKHSDTKRYDASFGTGAPEDYVPNYLVEVGKDNLLTSCSLGNYGVSDTYKLTVTNSGKKTRYFALDITTASAIIAYQSDENREVKEAYLKNVSGGKETVVMLEKELPPESTQTFYFSVILPVNYNGGTLNQFKITDESRFQVQPAMEKEECTLLNGVFLEEAELPQHTSDVFDGNLRSFSYLKGKDNALVRWCAWDGKPYYNYLLWGYTNCTYLLDKNGHIIGSSAFQDLPCAASWKDDVYYLELASGKVVQSKDGVNWTPYAGTLPAYVPYYDLENASDWAAELLEEAYDNKIRLNRLDNGYQFTEDITRQDFCRLAMCYLRQIDRVPTPSENLFSDIEDEEINCLVTAGILFGFEDGTFRPNEKITREQAAAILERLFKYSELKLDLPDISPSYADEEEISDWALSAADFMYQTGIMIGGENNTFQPQNSYTREQAAVTLLRLYNLTKQNDFKGVTE